MRFPKGGVYVYPTINKPIKNLQHMALKPIPSLPAYYATHDGRIFKYRKKDDTLFQLSDNSRSNSGYKMVQPYKDGKRMLKYVHQLVAEAFHGPRPEGLVCDHINQDKFDNRADNLRYVTKEENAANCSYVRPKGVKYNQHINPIYKKYAALVQQLRKEGKTLQVIADELQISTTQVSNAERYSI